MDEKLLEVALKASKAAEEVALKYLSDEVVYSLKEDQTPVTLADPEAEKIIKETILAEFPDHGFLGEETGESNTDSEYTWIIDPIDGTKNYMRKLPFFSIEIALMKGDEIILGISNSPVQKSLIWAQKGKGAFHNGKQVKVSDKSELNKSFICYGGLDGFIRNERVEQLTGLVKQTLAARGFGDSWSYQLVAQGKVDVMVEAKVKIWDVAAVSLIVEEAGGKVTTLDGKPITKDVTNIIASNGLLHDQIVENFNS